MSITHTNVYLPHTNVYLPFGDDVYIENDQAVQPDGIYHVYFYGCALTYAAETAENAAQRRLSDAIPNPDYLGRIISVTTPDFHIEHFVVGSDLKVSEANLA